MTDEAVGEYEGVVAIDETSDQQESPVGYNEDGLLPKWEYMSLEFPSLRRKGMTKRLNEFGRQGWELVGFAASDPTLGINTLVCILKRERWWDDSFDVDGEEDAAEAGPVVGNHLAPPIDNTPGHRKDPTGRYAFRHWDGERWTSDARTMYGGVVVDELPEAAPTAPEGSDTGSSPSCPSCGALHPSTYRFCAACGEPAST